MGVLTIGGAVIQDPVFFVKSLKNILAHVSILSLIFGNSSDARFFTIAFKRPGCALSSPVDPWKIFMIWGTLESYVNTN